MSKYVYKKSEDGRRVMFGKKRNKLHLYMYGYEARVFLNIACKHDSPQKEQALDSLYSILSARANAQFYDKIFTQKD